MRFLGVLSVNCGYSECNFICHYTFNNSRIYTYICPIFGKTLKPPCHIFWKRLWICFRLHWDLSMKIPTPRQEQKQQPAQAERGSEANKNKTKAWKARCAESKRARSFRHLLHLHNNSINIWGRVAIGSILLILLLTMIEFWAMSIVISFSIIV